MEFCMARVTAIQVLGDEKLIYKPEGSEGLLAKMSCGEVRASNGDDLFKVYHIAQRSESRNHRMQTVFLVLLLFLPVLVAVSIVHTVPVVVPIVVGIVGIVEILVLLMPCRCCSGKYGRQRYTLSGLLSRVLWPMFCGSRPLFFFGVLVALSSLALGVLLLDGNVSIWTSNMILKAMSIGTLFVSFLAGIGCLVHAACLLFQVKRYRYLLEQVAEKQMRLERKFKGSLPP
jgi:hypothetical protein